MDSVIGVFREGEIDGNKFLIFTLLAPEVSLSGEDTTDSDDDNIFSLEPLFLCPSFRLKVLKIEAEKNDLDDDFLSLDVSPLFLCQPSEYMKCSNCCKLPLHPSTLPNKKKISLLGCAACNRILKAPNYYYCRKCRGMFHKECVESPLTIDHPFYPFESFQLSIFFKTPMKCTICYIDFLGLGYQILSYRLTMHTDCVMKPIPMVINDPKKHHHPLTYSFKKTLIPCNICGFIEDHIRTYVCLCCVFVVHHDCISSPNTIKINRHYHRISITYSIPSGNLTCIVCRKNVDRNYGVYSCNKCVGYFVHRRCALRNDVYGGEELEGVTED